jgi:L-asparaginase/Glu-tRNA(Gln) amidotransferase subunit D
MRVAKRVVENYDGETSNAAEDRSPEAQRRAHGQSGDLLKGEARRKLMWAARHTTQEKIRPENAAPMM